jgi:hypothetical protein
MQSPDSDTHPEAMQAWIELLRKMSPGQKIATVFELIRFAREMAAAGVRFRHPTADEREVFLRVAAQSLSRDEMIRAYQWDPHDHGLSGSGV